MTAYRVSAPYVTLRVMDELAGKLVLHGFHRDAPVPAGVAQEDLDRHLRKGMVVKVEQPTEVPEQVEVPAELATGPVKPRQGDPKDAWVAYAAAQRPEGQSEEDARAEAEGMSKADLIATFGG